jgi:hypothetical protein
LKKETNMRSKIAQSLIAVIVITMILMIWQGLFIAFPFMKGIEGILNIMRIVAICVFVIYGLDVWKTPATTRVIQTIEMLVVIYLAITLLPMIFVQLPVLRPPLAVLRIIDICVVGGCLIYLVRIWK